MDEHDRSDEDAPNQSRHAAPAGYAAPSANRAAGRQGSAAPLPPSWDATGSNPVYGRVTRFGPADHLPASPPAVPDPGWPTPAAPAPAWHAAAPAPWAQGAPPWTTPPPSPLEPPDGYASWSRRVAGYLIDEAPGLVASAVLTVSYVPLYVGLLRRDLAAHPTWTLFVVGLVLSMAAFAWSVYNRWVLAGRTGQSAGKKVMRTWLVGTVDGRPIGVLNAFLRDLLHTLDGIAYVGYLWPLWDDRRQTLADKVIQSAVVRTPVPPLTDFERSRRP